MTAAGSLITPPEANEETTYKELCTSDDEQLCEQDIEEDNEELRHDLSENYAYKSIIEQWFQAGTRLDPFNFSFYFVHLQFQSSISHVYIYFRLSIVKLKEDIFLFMLHLWLHWKFEYT